MQRLYGSVESPRAWLCLRAFFNGLGVDGVYYYWAVEVGLRGWHQVAFC